MSFGLFNIPASFQGYINKITAKKLNIFIIVYLDNIFIYIKYSGQVYINAFWSDLKKLRKYDLIVNLKKCRFYKEKVRFLGYVVSVKRVQMEDERIKGVKNWPETKSIHDIQVFCGFPNFYQCFI